MKALHENLVEDRRDNIAVLRIDRTESLGALSKTMVHALGNYFDELAHDTSVKALVITGTGRGFIAGADIGEYDGATRDAFDEYQRRARRVFETLAGLPQPTIAAVNGFALGGGFELALCCDLILASTEARFGLPEIRLGLLPGGGGTVRLPRVLGTRLAKELVLTGRTMHPEEAHRHGLVTAVVEPSQLLPQTIELAERIATAAPVAAREAKRLIDDGMATATDAALTREQQVLSWLFSTDDAQEGIAAFQEKRKPVFHGR